VAPCGDRALAAVAMGELVNMVKKEVRNAEILRLSDGGLPREQLAARFGMAKSSVNGIVQRERAARKSVQILDEIRTSCGLNTPIPARMFMEALQFDTRSGKAIGRHFSEGGIDSLSLMQLTDFLIPDGLSPEAASDIWDALPALAVKGVSPDGFLALVMRLSVADLGDSFQQEWRKRKTVLFDSVKARALIIPRVLRKRL
jgi:hypothetical protein